MTPPKKRAPPRRAATATSASAVAPRQRSTAKKTDAVTVRSAEFEALVAALGGVAGVTLEAGWGAGNTVLKVDAKIFAMNVGSDLVVKLPKSRVDELVGAGAGTQFDPRGNGRLMKEWLVVKEGRANWLELARQALSFVKPVQR